MTRRIRRIGQHEFPRHAAAVIVGCTALFAWLFARPLLVNRGYIAESDLYEFFLPVFLSPMTVWSSFEFGGTPAFADPGEATLYPLHFLCARVLGSWTAFIASAYIVGASGTYAYVYSFTRSRLAAACAGLAFGLSEALTEQLAHLGILHTIVWLPLLALAVDRLRGDRWQLWIAVGALVTANCFLGGNPQSFLYIGVAMACYAIAGGVAERAGLRYYLAGAAMVALAALMVAVQALPTLEASLYTARETVNFGQFVGHGNTPAQMLSIVIPAIVHEAREAPTYVGLITLLFAFVALRQASSNWRVVFWGAIAIVCLMLGAGDATPVPRLAFELPFYDKFRVVGRHLFLAAFALSALAGIGIAAAQAHAVSWRLATVATTTLALLVGTAAAAVAAWPEAFPLDALGGLQWGLPIWNSTVWGQIALACLSITAAVAFFRQPNHRLTAGALVLALGIDLVCGVSYFITPLGFAYEVIPDSAIEPSVHAVRLRQLMAESRQRLLSPAGTQVDAVVPGVFARLWRLPIAGGYGPMLLRNYRELAMMDPNGSVDPMLLASHNAALDIMAVRFVTVARSALEPGPTVENQGLPWTAEPLGLLVGPPECGQRHPRHAAFALPDASITEVAIVARLRCSEDVVQGTQVATLTVAGRDGTFTFPLRAGVEIAEEGLSDAALRRRARHTPGVIFYQSADRYSYVTRAKLPHPLSGARLELAVGGTAGSLQIDRITAVAADGRPMPQSRLGATVGDTQRWRQADTFSTSRVTDRTTDRDVPGEEAFVVMENLRARPRAWLATNVLPLAPAERDIALHFSQLPDGRPFDPASTALVESSEAATQYGAGESTVHVRAIADGAISVDVSSANGGFLVLSETYYPGWQARVDGAAVRVQLVDGALQGVEVSRGQHAVQFEFRSRTLTAGRAISASGCLVTLAIMLYRRRDGASTPAKPRYTDTRPVSPIS